MTHPIYLLTDVVAGAALSTVLSEHGHDGPVVLLESGGALDRLFAVGEEGDEAMLPGRLIGFFTETIVPARYLARLDMQPINFHPGPLECPGKLPIKFAWMEAAAGFGVTVHEMTPSVDSGPILSVARFGISPHMAEPALRYHTYQSGFRLFRNLVPHLTATARIPAISDAIWSSRICSQAAFDALPGVAGN